MGLIHTHSAASTVAIWVDRSSRTDCFSSSMANGLHQNTQATVPISAPFQAFSGSFSDPFREDNLLGRLDYQLTMRVRVLFTDTLISRICWGRLSDSATRFADNKDITRNDVVGLDFNTGPFTHSIRFSFLKFHESDRGCDHEQRLSAFRRSGRGDFHGSHWLGRRAESISPAEHTAKRSRI